MLYLIMSDIIKEWIDDILYCIYYKELNYELW